MSQLSFGDTEYAGKRKQTRREVFLQEIELVVPWRVLPSLIERHYPKSARSRPPYPLLLIHLHLMQNWFGLSDPGMEEALYEITAVPAVRAIASDRGAAGRDDDSQLPAVAGDARTGGSGAVGGERGSGGNRRNRVSEAKLMRLDSQ